ncbi:cytochrome P450 4C1-like [Adelges cooleyi]|uniref:cytochrome P450 4C1-like n=1 Tax=Adelges cooleyi TaxID=133065 RepID=UPI00217F695A|nr:cytochrome P450 4C1-like [Adelges cooleyi]
MPGRYEHSIFKYWLFRDLCVCVSKAEDVKEVMSNSNCFKKPMIYSVLRDTFSMDGLLTTNNIHNYKNGRKIISLWLKYSNLKSLIPIFYEEFKVLEHILSKKVENKSYECDISRAIELASMDTIGRTAFGEKFDSQKKENHVFRHNYERLAEIFIYRIERPWCYVSSFFSLSPRKREQRKSQHLIHTFLNDLIRKNQAEGNEVANTAIDGSDDENSICQQKPKPLIKNLLENGHGMSYKMLRGHLTTITVAGHDTTAITNTIVIFMLAHHQDVQENVFREISSIFSVDDSDRPPTYEDLQKMEYLERVIKETMRFYPAVPIMGRKIENEMKIGKYVVPAGTNVMVPIYCLHLNPQHYKDPKVFNPDNFLPDVCRSRHPFAYIPFSVGSRSCVGNKYAMLQMKIAISTLVRAYRFSPSAKCPTPKDLRLSYNMVLKFVDGCYVTIDPRT